MAASAPAGPAPTITARLPLPELAAAAAPACASAAAAASGIIAGRRRPAVLLLGVMLLMPAFTSLERRAPVMAGVLGSGGQGGERQGQLALLAPPLSRKYSRWTATYLICLLTSAQRPPSAQVLSCNIKLPILLHGVCTSLWSKTRQSAGSDRGNWLPMKFMICCALPPPPRRRAPLSLSHRCGLCNNGGPQRPHRQTRQHMASKPGGCREAGQWAEGGWRRLYGRTSAGGAERNGCGGEWS